MKRRNFIKGLLGISGAAVAGVKIDASSLESSSITPWECAVDYEAGHVVRSGGELYAATDLEEILRPAAQKMVGALEADLAKYMLSSVSML